MSVETILITTQNEPVSCSPEDMTSSES